MNRLFLTLIFFLSVFSSCKKDPESTNNPVAPRKFKVKYAMGCSDCKVMYYKDSLETQQTEFHQNASWTYTFYGKRGQNVLQAVTNTSNTDQAVWQDIYVNDTLLTTQLWNCAINQTLTLQGIIP